MLGKHYSRVRVFSNPLEASPLRFLKKEPQMLPGRRDQLGLLGNPYLELNDYCRSLVDLLHQAPGIEILEFDPDCIGKPPLTSLHFIAWRFR